ncbi:MAG: bifunctional oligoribonuclease/PAP phosphatase NrnA [Lachnospiraceae bacterium]|nr:bifunctional oligoribonuclease/PAP phosphatase NrnA [Lachnospiraceae bacterium]
MSYEVKKQILDKIKEYDKIVIIRHFRPDGDAIGTSKGLQRLLQLSFPEKSVKVINHDYSDYIAFLGDEDEEISDEEYAESLVIVVDTGTLERVSNENARKGKEIIKIDHHEVDIPYGDIAWVEDWRAACAEMIVDFYLTFKDELKMDKLAATYLFTGMVTDSGRFRFSSVNGDSMRLAGALLDFGIDLESLYANLYLDEFDNVLAKAESTKMIKMTENGVAYIYISQEYQKEHGLSREDASNMVSLMNEIKGSIIWIAFIETEENIRVRLRSRFVPVIDIARQYRGGGHDRASGATVLNQEEVKALLAEADRVIKEFKENNTGWM